MHRFKIYDVDREGNRYDAHRVVIVETLPTLNHYGVIDGYTRGSIVSDLFRVFGFDQYQGYYSVRKLGEDYEIAYNYAEGGVKATWFLKRGV